jgi:hypothetical protein
MRSSHGDSGLRGMSGPRAPHDRGAAVLRCDGTHPGKNSRATRHDAAGASQEGDQGGGKKSTAVVVLTMGRRCRRCRLGEEDLAGEVDVHGDGLPRAQLLALGPCSAPLARRGGGALLFRLSDRGRQNRKPQRGWWLGHPGRSLSLLLKPGAASVDAKAPGCPGFDRPDSRGGTSLLCACQVAGARGAGANEENPALAGFDSCASVRAGPSACGLDGRGGHPITRARPRCESPGAVRIRGGEEKVRIGESGWLTRGPRLSAGDSWQRKGVRFSGPRFGAGWAD